ncbi:hypothetical protein C2G38_2253295 [Gigaspora rosea]|uniref:BTB domain-containing protein n=1 Tax=Gigaspora rosea TaxID=44941 RepID=A0A397UGP4_9GLOM|nr:hypothetical protein C2G38_2253295 [Gigaspora rosea]
MTHVIRNLGCDNSTISRVVQDNLNELLKNSDEYNVIIEVGQEPNDQAFKQPNISIEVFDIIKYIYNGTVSLETVNISVIFELLIASSEFGLEELIKHIQLFLLENNSSWLRLNFSHIYQASFKNDNLKDLQQFCANIIAKHPKIIFDS